MSYSIGTLTNPANWGSAELTLAILQRILSRRDVGRTYPRQNPPLSVAWTTASYPNGVFARIGATDEVGDFTAHSLLASLNEGDSRGEGWLRCFPVEVFSGTPQSPSPTLITRFLVPYASERVGMWAISSAAEFLIDT